MCPCAREYAYAYHWIFPRSYHHQAEWWEKIILVFSVHNCVGKPELWSIWERSRDEILRRIQIFYQNICCSFLLVLNNTMFVRVRVRMCVCVSLDSSKGRPLQDKIWKNASLFYSLCFCPNYETLDVIFAY